MTITITATPEHDHLPPRVVLTASITPSTSTPMVVTRIHQDGTRWPVLSTSDPVFSGGLASSVDYHAPHNETVTYEMVAAGQTGTVDTILVSDETWLVHRSEPTLSVAVEQVNAVGDPTYPVQESAYRPIGAKYAIDISDSPRGGATRTVIFECHSEETLEALHELLEDGKPFLIAAAYRKRDLGWQWVQPGPQVQGNLAGYSSWPDRTLTIPIRDTAQPLGDVMPEWTDDDMEATYASDTVMETTYATDVDLELDRRIA